MRRSLAGLSWVWRPLALRNAVSCQGSAALRSSCCVVSRRLVVSLCRRLVVSLCHVVPCCVMSSLKNSLLSSHGPACLSLSQAPLISLRLLSFPLVSTTDPCASVRHLLSNGLDGVEWVKVRQCTLDCAGGKVFGFGMPAWFAGWLPGWLGRVLCATPGDPASLDAGKNLPK